MRVSTAQIETLEEEMLILKRGSSTAQLSARYDEQIELLKRSSAMQASRDAEAVQLAQSQLVEARREVEESGRLLAITGS